jgi:hypothetical protein
MGKIRSVGVCVKVCWLSSADNGLKYYNVEHDAEMFFVGIAIDTCGHKKTTKEL